ncbi:MAG: DUF3616 domain-containing protein [Myxococcales bacterium]
MFRAVVCSLAALAACAANPVAPAPRATTAASEVPFAPPGVRSTHVASPRFVTFEGSCDASGAVVLDARHFVVGDDEDNVLRVYDFERGGPPVESVDISAFVGLEAKKRIPELDIEAATGLGELAFWLTSHGRKSSGKRDDSRFRFFATRRTGDGRHTLVGRPYTRLFEDLIAHAPLAPFELDKAEAIAPKEPGGLNIEGMTAAADGASVLIGFRSPVPGGNALVVSLLNPSEVIEGGRAKLGEPRLLPLGGLGVRSISWWRGRYLIAAGAVASGGQSRLFVWNGDDAPPRAADEVDLADFNPEAFVTPEDRDEILLLSDDGSRPGPDGVECKRQSDPAKKRFRGMWTRLKD